MRGECLEKRKKKRERASYFISSLLDFHLALPGLSGLNLSRLEVPVRRMVLIRIRPLKALRRAGYRGIPE